MNADKCLVNVSEKIPSCTHHRSVRTSTALTVIWIDLPCLFPLNVPETLHTLSNFVIISLSLVQEGEQSGSGQDVLSNLHFRGMEGQERSNPFCHRTARGGRKHTGKRRKLELSEGVVNILQCNVTTWSEHAKHYILTSDFDATLISETHLRKEGLLSAVTEAKKSGWAGTGSAATNTVNNGTSAGVLALVRKRWFSKPLSICSDDAGTLCPNSRLAGRVIRVMGREILLLTAYFEHSVGFRSDTNANLMQDVCFLTRDGRFPFILGADFNFPPSQWQDLTLHGGDMWIKQLGASVVIPEGSSHTCRTGGGQKPDIIDYFMVSACIRPLIQRCEVIKSVPWGPHYGVKLVLNIDFESVLSRQLERSAGAVTTRWVQHWKVRMQICWKKPTHHSGKQQDSSVGLKAESPAAVWGRKPLRRPAPSTPRSGNLERCHSSILGFFWKGGTTHAVREIRQISYEASSG